MTREEAIKNIKEHCYFSSLIPQAKEALNMAIKALEQEPKTKTEHWILADEQNKEDVENDNYRFICSECQCSDIHTKGAKVPYCWKCGAKMEVGNELLR